jgi:hypothetical protein
VGGNSECLLTAWKSLIDDLRMEGGCALGKAQLLLLM